MPITFESLKDPYGIQQAGSALGQALIQRTMEKNAEDQVIRAEDRKKADLLKNNSILGNTMKEFLPKEGETWDENRISQFMQSALSQGASFSDVYNAAQLFQKPSVTKPKMQPPSVYQKESEKNVAKYIQSSIDKSTQANELLAQYPDLMAAINSPELEQQNFLTRLFKGSVAKLPGGAAFMNEQEQVLSSLSKQMVTELTNLKGLRLTDPKLRWLEGAVVQVGKSPEANRKAAQITFDLLQVAAQRPAIINEIIAKNGGVPPLDLQSQVDKKLGQEFNEYIDQHADIKESGSSFSIDQTLDKMPPASGNEGMEIQDDKGNRFVSNGKTWKKVK